MAEKRDILRISKLGLFIIVISCLRVSSTLGHKPLLYNIMEEGPPETFVGNVARDVQLHEKYDSDTLRTLRFSFLTQPELPMDRPFFNIEEKTGIIRTIDRLDRDAICPDTEQDCVIEFDVAISPVKYFEIIKILLTIEDKNDNAPRFPQRQALHSLSESTLPGAGFNIPPAHDPDKGINSIASYSFKPNPGKFELQVRATPDGSSILRLVLRQRLDREKEKKHIVKVIAQDGGSPSLSGSVDIHITVIDANDNDALFENSTYETAVAENVPVGTNILKVKARDADEGQNGIVTYSFDKVTQQEHGHLFGIRRQTGQLFVRSPLDYETKKMYLLSISAQDKGADSLPAHTTAVVHVKDYNDNAPSIKVNTLTESREAEVIENAKAGTFVTHLSVVDIDSGENGQFMCSLDDRKFHLQKLYKTEFKVVTSTSFDREVQSKMSFVVTCHDQGHPPLSSSTGITVNILDRNDHAPLFGRPSYSATIRENNKKGTFILRVNATDKDTGRNGKIRYDLAEDAKNHFVIDPETGMLAANIKFDHEKMQSAKFHVIASDHGDQPYSTQCIVKIRILDEDDELPIFSLRQYNFGIRENNPIKTKVGAVIAKDSDSPPFNRFVYSFDKSFSSVEDFHIDANNGRIRTQRLLDRENLAVYYLRAVAKSVENPKMFSTASVTIYVTDDNDNRPLFLFPKKDNNSVTVSKFSPIGHRVTQVRARDLDSGINARVSYSLLDGDLTGLFALSADTGILTLERGLESVEQKSFALEIEARDHGTHALASSEKLYIMITDTVSSSQLGFSIFSGDNLLIITAFGCAAFLVVFITITVILIARKKDGLRRRRQTAKDLLKPTSVVHCPEPRNNNGRISANHYVTVPLFDDKSKENQGSISEMEGFPDPPKEVTENVFTLDIRNPKPASSSASRSADIGSMSSARSNTHVRGSEQHPPQSYSTLSNRTSGGSGIIKQQMRTHVDQRYPGHVTHSTCTLPRAPPPARSIQNGAQTTGSIVKTSYAAPSCGRVTFSDVEVNSLNSSMPDSSIKPTYSTFKTETSSTFSSVNSNRDATSGYHSLRPGLTNL